MSARQMLTALALSLAALLAGCGGGCDEEEPPSKGFQPIDCKANPELCK